MPGGPISYALLAGLATALLTAAVTDLRRREIDNRLNAAIALTAPLFWLASGLGAVEILFQLALALGTFLLAWTLFALRQMGGGDVKLLTALALWFVPGSFAKLIVMMGMLGGAASIALAVFNMRRRPGEAGRDALSLGAATIWVMLATAFVYGVATGHSLFDAATIVRIADILPLGWPLLLLALGALALTVLGFAHIFRRQRGAIPIPYGVAISAAGLWIASLTALDVPLPG